MIDGDDYTRKETVGDENIRDLDPISQATKVVTTTYLIKTGKIEGLRHTMDTRPFSLQKAKAVNISDFSFPTFVIRTQKQRSSIVQDPESIEDLRPGSDDAPL